MHDPESFTTPLLVLDLEHGLAKVAALEHVDEAVGGLLDALGEMDLCLDAAVGEPVTKSASCAIRRNPTRTHTTSASSPGAPCSAWGQSFRRPR